VIYLSEARPQPFPDRLGCMVGKPELIRNSSRHRVLDFRICRDSGAIPRGAAAAVWNSFLRTAGGPADKEQQNGCLFFLVALICNLEVA
jgi:hypothetical protein